MCGIVGILGNQPVAPLILSALKRLEYRGYDSAGIATVKDGILDCCRVKGKLINLELALKQQPLNGLAGIGHTRWATHGAPEIKNAHPHFVEDIAIVHNGIIENFSALKQALLNENISFKSDTDTEVIVHILAQKLRAGFSPKDAVFQTLQKLEGAFALAILFRFDDNLLVVARQGSPIAIGHGHGEVFVGSDAIALSEFTNQITYLEDGDWAMLTRDKIEIFASNGQNIKRPIQHSSVRPYQINKGNHRHFMMKEIYEQPEVVAHTLSHYLDFTRNALSNNLESSFDWNKISRLTISACGTAYLAGLIGQYWFESLARLPVEIDFASEFRYRETPLEKGGLSIFISQSGETADTLAALRYCHAQQQHIASIVNVAESTIARESDSIFPTLAGPEIGVASSKAFTCQLSVLAALAIKAAQSRATLSQYEQEQLILSLAKIPRLMTETLLLESQIETVARELSRMKSVLYLGRGVYYPLALEGALKLKELSYIHAEGYAAGELKHGPIALIDEDMPVIVLAPYNQLFEKTLSNMQEIKARGGQIILFTDAKGAKKADITTKNTITLPQTDVIFAPLIYSVPIQLLAYHTAVFMGKDVDQPRNLAKSVTVE